MNISLPDAMVGHVLVFDVAVPFVYVGRFTGEEHGFLVLEEADAHDLRDTNTTREKYILDVRHHGVRANRRKVYLDPGQVVAFSLLEDVVE